jgi:hypothetical protein
LFASVEAVNAISPVSCAGDQPIHFVITARRILGF